MNLDEAIQSSLKLNAMDSAMQSVVATLGPQYDVLATPNNPTTASQTIGTPIALMNHSPHPSAVATKEARSVRPPVVNKNPFHAPKGMERVKQLGAEGINPMFRRTF